MDTVSFNEDLDYNDSKVVAKVLLETSFSKEIRILLKKEQVMKEHKAPYPIIIHVLEGKIDFGVEGKVNQLNKGSMITLDANVAHDLTALQDSIVRLTLSKLDTISRVEEAAKNS